MDVKDHLILTELKQLARAERDVKLSKRMQMVVLAMEGYTAPAIARSLSCSRRVCQQSGCSVTMPMDLKVCRTNQVAVSRPC